MHFPLKHIYIYIKTYVDHLWSSDMLFIIWGLDRDVWPSWGWPCSDWRFFTDFGISPEYCCWFNHRISTIIAKEHYIYIYICSYNFSLKIVLLVSVSICVHCFPCLVRMVQPSHTGCHLPRSRPGGCPNPNTEMQCRRLPEELSFHGPDGNILWTVETWWFPGCQLVQVAERDAWPV